MGIDEFDEKIIAQLRSDARISNANLAIAVGLSQSACLRRVRRLEASGVIRGYTVLLETRREQRGTVVFVQLTLERQTDEFLSRFERAVRRHPEVRECYLMTGPFDYQLQLVVRDTTEYERVHRDVLSSLPGVARIQSSFTIRPVIEPAA